MYKVKLTTTSPEWPLQKQTPGENGIWGNCQFLINSEVDECDFWVVYEDLLELEVTHCPPQNTLLMTAEPPSVKSYVPQFTKQFFTIITCNRQIKAPHVIYTQTCLPWHIGRRSKNHTSLGFTKNYDELKSIQKFDKKKSISVITSDKKFTKGHRQRVEFVNKLMQHFGHQIDVFGRGFNEIEDKWDAIVSYKYHIALENCSYPDYWTEKLSDAYLGGALPLYYGCPNLENYFPRNSFVPITYDFRQAVSMIEKIIQEDRYEDFLPEIISARMLILDRYNLFPRLHELINQMACHEPRLPITLKPARLCSSPLFKASDRVRRVIRRYL